LKRGEMVLDAGGEKTAGNEGKSEGPEKPSSKGKGATMALEMQLTSKRGRKNKIQTCTLSKGGRVLDCFVKRKKFQG